MTMLLNVLCLVSDASLLCIIDHGSVLYLILQQILLYNQQHVYYDSNNKLNASAGANDSIMTSTVANKIKYETRFVTRHLELE